MKVLHILGSGCQRCNQLEANTRAAADQAGIEYELLHVKDINEIMDFGVMMTPALVVDGEVKVVGKVLTVDEIKSLLA